MNHFEEMKMIEKRAGPVFAKHTLKFLKSDYFKNGHKSYWKYNNDLVLHGCRGVLPESDVHVAYDKLGIDASASFTNTNFKFLCNNRYPVRSVDLVENVYFDLKLGSFDNFLKCGRSRKSVCLGDLSTIGQHNSFFAAGYSNSSSQDAAVDLVGDVLVFVDRLKVVNDIRNDYIFRKDRSKGRVFIWARVDDLYSCQYAVYPSKDRALQIFS